MAHFTTDSLKLENNIGEERRRIKDKDKMFCEADPVSGLSDVAEDVR